MILAETVSFSLYDIRLIASVLLKEIVSLSLCSWRLIASVLLAKNLIASVLLAKNCKFIICGLWQSGEIDRIFEAILVMIPLIDD